MILVKLGQIKNIFLSTHLKRVLRKKLVIIKIFLSHYPIKKREIFPFQLILYQTDGHLHLQDLEQYNHSH